jgi:hypothetical protein
MAASLTLISATHNPSSTTLTGNYPTGWTAGMWLILHAGLRISSTFTAEPAGSTLVGKNENVGAATAGV